MSTVSADQIKKHGVSVLAPILDDDGEAVITVRGKATYVVMTLAHYNTHREAALLQAVHEARADYEAGRVDDRRVDDHMKRLDNEV